MPTNEQAKALSDAWFAADRAQAKSMLRHEMGDVTDQLSQLTNEIRDQQQDVSDERGQWNTTGSVLGCVGGGIIGFLASGGNPLGAMAGCSLGGKATATMTDWAYDGRFFDTEAEEELRALEKELDAYEIELSEKARHYNLADTNAWIQQTRDKQLQLMYDYDSWKADFYGATGGDYIMELVSHGLTFAATKIGGEILDGLFGGAEEIVDFTEVPEGFMHAEAIGPMPGAEYIDPSLMDVADDLIMTNHESSLDLLSDSLDWGAGAWPAGTVPSADPFGVVGLPELTTGMLEENYNNLKSIVNTNISDMYQVDNYMDWLNAGQLSNPSLFDMYGLETHKILQGVE